MSADPPHEAALAAAFAGGRLAIGAGLWLSPRRAMRALGFSEPPPEALALARLAATRDLALGAWLVASRGDPAAHRTATLACAACDAGDALAFGLLLRAQPRGAIRGIAAAIPAAALGAWLGTRRRADP